ncbi:hypothetical protein MMC08_002095 [Hypocenomyce scalaris]|nr:hypothetical protein [Hypocenomyce scalaris]
MRRDKDMWSPKLPSIDSTFHNTANGTNPTRQGPPMTSTDSTKTTSASPHPLPPDFHPEIKANRDPDAPDIQDSLLTRLVLTPLLCISFLLSLLLVDNRNHERSHPHAAPPRDTPLGKLSAPWVRTDGDTWVWQVKKRKLARTEMGQAFEIRKWVLVALVLVGVGAMGAGVLVVKWVWGRVGTPFLGNGKLGWA